MAKTSINLRVSSVVGASYVPSGKVVQVDFSTHLHDEDNTGIIASSDVMLTLREAEQLLEELTEIVSSIKEEAYATA
jgi:hypothetical protein